MTKAKITLCLVLIFLAGGIAGAGIRSAWKPGRVLPPRRGSEDFANHIFKRLQEQIELTPEQVKEIEPVFRRGFAEVKAIQDRSLKEIEAAVKGNHEEIGKLISAEQRQKLEEMDRQREKSFHEHRGGFRRPPGHPGGS